MKKAANWGGLEVTLNSTLIPHARERARAHTELQLLYAGFDHAQAEIRADQLIKSSLIGVVDTDSGESNLRSQQRDDQPAKSVSFHPREPLFFRWLETENSWCSASNTGALDKGGNR